MNISRGAVNNFIGAENNLQWIFQQVYIVKMHINSMTYSLQVIHCTYEFIHCTGGCPLNLFTAPVKIFTKLFTKFFISVFTLPYILFTSFPRPLSEGFHRLPFLYSRRLRVRFQKLFTDCHISRFSHRLGSVIWSFLMRDTPSIVCGSWTRDGNALRYLPSACLLQAPLEADLKH